MTEIGIVQYYEAVEEGSEAYANGFRHIVVRLGQELTDINSWAVCELKELTRAEVEAYLKEKGWDWVAKDIIRKYGDIYCSIIEQGGKYFVSSVFGEEQFDTAPEQLAEAILMARLLNAVK